ncbi:DNA gyrase subunit B [Frankliniella fusca]|uniref:DNA gyrase subunit B n=1 Tax=Frankliniella fusca TaxID=407009 RepID=A0AAE1LBP5_9NEOP|nr:DNA gyrase subunit B [Frankliniella fusca]
MSERKDLFYGSQAVVLKSKVGTKTMHPEQVQLSHPVENLVEPKLLKPQDVVEDEIDIEKVDNGDVNGSGKEEQNGNGVHLMENGHPQQLNNAKPKEKLEEKLETDSDGRTFLRVRTVRRNSTSSRSSSVSSAPSLKHQTPMAMQMEVSMDFEERDHMDPLIIDGNAEDLEVSMSASHDEADDGATTDSEAITDQNNDPYEFDDDFEPDYEPEILHKKSKPVKAIKGTKTVKASPKPKPVKSKTPRAKSLKLKTSKSSPKLSEKLLEEIDAENSDTNSLNKDDTESEDLNIKTQKSPKRSKTTPTKLDVVEEKEGDVKGGEAEHVPRRSSRSRQTPQKYNSSLYADWDHPISPEDRMNNSDAVYGASIRSVKGRRSLRKARNISVLNTSLHNESSPWDNDFKVLTPCGGGVSIHNVPDSDNLESSTPLKRKAAEEDNDIENERGQKKMCVENNDPNLSSSSHTSSFFSVITSPIIMLKNKFRGSTVSSSTPVRENKPVEVVEQDMPSEIDVNLDQETKDDVVTEKEVPQVEGMSGEETIDVDVVTPSVETTPVEVAQEAKSWCSIM